MYTLWWREITRFCRQRSRWSSALMQPLLVWLLLGGGFRASFRLADGAADTGYMEYFYPGVLTMVMLFTAIFATIAVVEDRREGFLQGVLVAPVSRFSIVLGQALGSTTLALLQGALLLVLTPLIGLTISLPALLLAVLVLFGIAFGMTNLGLIIAWRLRSTQGFHAIMNLLLMPLWLLSGAFFPAAGAPVWLTWVMWLNPLTYGVAALRRSLYLADATAVGAIPSLLPALMVTGVFGIVTLLLAVHTARRSTL
ncbi:MAG: multidrug ABC transporter permease [Candidatus Tectomicrobia bacterium]|uniref:Transport permease protein n=1 Tax=Tectimicrobiota bacterium TaxID=2528274 RepID=A0A937W558_UNCTE|nr:multidrug ABC transporter permease [Candidatus Tectomicrobia bacterium]